VANFKRLGRALRHRNYRLFFGGQLVSLIGTWMQSVAQSWLVYRLTGSTILLGLVGFCGQIPVFLLAPIGGMVADRVRRHRVILATQITMMLLAFVLAALTLTGTVRVAYVIALAAALGVANAFDIPARQSFLVEMVGRENLVNAIALNSSMVNGARIVGPALAGITVAAIGEGWCFVANGVSFLAVIAGLLAMRDLPAARTEPSKSSPLADIAEGFAYVGKTAPVRALLLLLGLVSLMGVPYVTLMPAIAHRVLHRGADGVGILMGATGIGALLGALTLAAKDGLQGLGRWVMGAAALFGASLIAFSFSRSFWVSFALLVPTGYGFMVQMAASNTLVQSMSPDAMRGRVMAVYSMMFMGMAPFGALLAGALAARVGPARTVGLGGACTVVGALAFAAAWPRLRAEAREIVVGLRERDGEASKPEAGIDVDR
jgi:MFS family permease